MWLITWPLCEAMRTPVRVIQAFQVLDLDQQVTWILPCVLDSQVVLKPSELTPLTAIALAELADRAGIPAGVFNVVMGDAPAIGEHKFFVV